MRLTEPAPRGAAIPTPDYTAAEHRTWELLYARQRALLPGRACEEFLAGLALMGFPEDRIPALSDVSRVLVSATGWDVARVPGMLHEEDFFGLLAERVFPSTDYIRPRHEMDYTPAPDLFHDIFGHTPMITNPMFADFYQRLGAAALRARGANRRKLERFYWFTVEFGLIRTTGGLRIYGNGILSSRAEVEHSLTEKVTALDFDADRIAEQDYDVRHLQPLLFVIDSFDQLVTEFDAWALRTGLS
jgi:phenylalanine-4-hydroxylase